VAADSDSWLVYVAKVLAIARFDHPMHIYTNLLCIKSKLIGETDVYVSISRLSQFG
jgi:hypothetical protein